MAPVSMKLMGLAGLLAFAEIARASTSSGGFGKSARALLVAMIFFTTTGLAQVQYGSAFQI